MAEPGDHREEGELSEEGELPEEEEEPASKATSDAAQPAAAEAAPSAGPPRPVSSSQVKSPPRAERPGSGPGPSATSSRGLARADSYEQRERERQALRRDDHQQQQRGGEPDGRGREPDKSDKLRTEREKAELAAELDRLTYDLSFQEVRGNFVNACQDLRTAIKKLDKLLRRVKKKREDDVSLYPGCHEYAAAISNALKHVVVICSTGVGRMADMELANGLLRTAINYRHDVFSATQKRELEQQLRDSREFRHLFTDRNRGRSASKANGTPGAAGGGGEQGEQQQRLPLQRGPSQQLQQQGPLSGRSDGLQTSSKDDAVSEASHAAAGATSSRGTPGAGAAAGGGTAGGPGPAGSPVPPSPPGTARSGGSVAVATPAEGPAADTTGNLPPAPPEAAGSSSMVAAAAGSSSRGQPHAAAGGGSRGQIRIVLNSSVIGGAGGDAEAPAAAGVAGPSPGGLKRGAPHINDLQADDEDEQAAKRARQQQPEQQQQQQQQALLAAADAGGAGAANGAVLLSELPEVAAALNNPSQLQLVLQRLLSGQRLVLVLDLDHTLVNSAKFSEVDPEWEFKLEQLAADQLSRPRESRGLHRLGRVGMWTKLRPGVREFLQRAAERFELWIYTAGSKAYADAMVELLDPAGRYFGGRVIAQGLGGGADEAPADTALFKRLMQGLEGREPVVVIVDDSSAVWPHDRRNLFVVERYIYFPSSRKRFGMQGKSLLEIDRDECPSRGMLMTALRIFERLHSRVFTRLRGAPALATPEAVAAWDVRNVMAAEKRLVLQGVHLVFSRVIPLESNPRQHPLWQLAEQFGATCGEQVTPATTHIVATHGGTEKVMWAKQNNKHVVSPAWLECSCILWQRAHEERFPTPY